MALDLRTLDRIGAGLVIAATLGATMAVAGLGLKLHARFDREEEEARAKVESRAAALSALDRLQAALTATRRQFDEFRDKIPESGHIGDFLERLDTLMHDRQLVMNSLEPQPPVQENIFTRTPVLFSCSGSSSDLFHLLYDLETMDRVVTLESVTLSRSSLKEPCVAEIQASLYERAASPRGTPPAGR